MLKVTENKEAAVFRPGRLGLLVALVPAKDQSAFRQPEEPPFIPLRSLLPRFRGFWLLVRGLLFIPTLDERLTDSILEPKAEQKRKSDSTVDGPRHFGKYSLLFSFIKTWADLSFSDEGQLYGGVLADDIGVWVERFPLLGQEMLLHFADLRIQIGPQARGHHDDSINEPLLITGGVVFLSKFLGVVPSLSHKITKHSLFKQSTTELLLPEDWR